MIPEFVKDIFIKNNNMKLEKQIKNYNVLAYGLFLSIAVGMIPIMILGQVGSVIDCEDIEDPVKKTRCIEEILPTRDVIDNYVAPIMGTFMAVTAFSGIYYGWKRGNERENDRSPLQNYDEFRSASDSEENRQREIRLAEQRENEALKKKYDQMEELS